MKKLIICLKGALIGMISEYSFRVEFTYLQGFILLTLIISIVIDLYEDKN
jgi:hypothetical protein